MRSTDTHLVTRARQVILALLCSLSLSAENFSADSVLFAAYQQEDMTVWKEYIDTTVNLPYEYGYCGYIVAEAKKEGKEDLLPVAKEYVQRYRMHIEEQRFNLPMGHYEMYLSSVYVFELRLHMSMHPTKSMQLARKATHIAPNDPIVLSYYGTSLFYAPAPFGSKKEALTWFEKAKPLFEDPVYRFCWIREANEMYINQCHEKLKK